MRPNPWRLGVGIASMVLLYLILVLTGVDYAAVQYFDSLPPARAKSLGLFLILLLMTVCAGLGFWLAKARGRGYVAWPLVCFLLNVWGVIFLWSLPDAVPSRQSEDDPGPSRVSR